MESAPSLEIWDGRKLNIDFCYTENSVAYSNIFGENNLAKNDENKKDDKRPVILDKHSST